MATRVYVTKLGPKNVLTIEWEFEDIAELQKRVDDWGAKPETLVFCEKWSELLERGGVIEWYDLRE